MKRTLRLLTLAGAIATSLFCTKASAQITAINATLNDSTANSCSPPFLISDDIVYTVTGTPQPLDSITFFISWGDGTTSTYKQPTTQGYAGLGHTYNTTGTFTYSVTMTNTNSVSTTLTSQPIFVTNSCATLQGDIYIDGNSNCTFDVGEEMPVAVLVKATNTTTSAVHYVFSYTSHYSLNVPDGYTYDIEITSLPPVLAPSCPLSGIITQVVAGAGPYSNNFGYVCTAAAIDLEAYGYSNGLNPGFTRMIQADVFSDNICGTNVVDVTLILDPLLSYVSNSYGPAPTVSGNTLTWTGVTVDDLFTSHMNIYTDPSAVLGSTICNTIYITNPNGPDADISNDTFQLCKIVSGSYDPNDKSVFPNVDAVGTIQDGEMLYYHINFQNTGTDTAYNVVVTDTLDNNLDMNTFQFIGSSHPVNVTWLEGNIINFRFENIYLPDSNVNEPASHGSVDYKIAAKTGLAPATEINNTAYIYFDFNEAVVTNTTLNTIETPQSVQHISNGSLSAQVFPNPANNELIVTTEGKTFSATVYDVVGRSVAVSITNTGKAVINTSTLANGMYILSIKADGKDMTTKINIQH